MDSHYSVIICGAGPVGLLIALRLGQAGVETLVLERHDGLLHTTRAMVYQPVVLDLLDKLGLREQIESAAYLNSDGIYWRDIKGNELGHLSMPKGDHVLLFGQYRMTKLVLEELQKLKSVELRFGVSYCGCEQSDRSDTVKVMVHDTTTDNDLMYHTNWLVGTDGANSSVRRSLCIPFEGFSFTDFRMIGADVLYDFSRDYGTVMNFVVDPDDWAVVIYTGEDEDGKSAGEASPIWRVAYVESPDLSSKPENILERAKERCARYSHDQKEVTITRAEPYRLHQRCAAQAIKGRVIIAGDALHSNNPIGGLGLTTGICDAYAIGNALARVCSGEKDPSFVVEAANDRRTTWLNTTNKISMLNLQRLRSQEPEDVGEREQFLKSLKGDPEMPLKVRGMIQQMAGKEFGKARNDDMLSESMSKL